MRSATSKIQAKIHGSVQRTTSTESEISSSFLFYKFSLKSHVSKVTTYSSHFYG